MNFISIGPKAVTQGTGFLIAVGLLLALTGCGLFTNPDYRKLQGVWEAKSSADQIFAIVVQDKTIVLGIEGNDNPLKGKIELKAGAIPQFDIVFEDPTNKKTERWQGIYVLSEKSFRAALSYNDNQPRPTSFTEQNTWVFEFKGEAKDFVPVDSDYLPGIATWHYWNSFSGIRSRHNFADPFAEPTSAEQVIEKCGAAIKVLGEVRDDVNKISIARVDPRVTAYAAEYLADLSDLEALLRDMVSILKDAQSLQNRSEPGEVIGMTILDYFRGKPAETINNLDEEAQLLQTRMLALRQRASEGSKTSDRLGTEQIKLRSYLNDKYGRDFRQFKL